MAFLQGIILMRLDGLGAVRKHLRQLAFGGRRKGIVTGILLTALHGRKAFSVCAGEQVLLLAKAPEVHR